MVHLELLNNPDYIADVVRDIDARLARNLGGQLNLLIPRKGLLVWCFGMTMVGQSINKSNSIFAKNYMSITIRKRKYRK